jgi:transcription antitermination factor NusG
MTINQSIGNLAQVRKDLNDNYHVGDIVDYSPFNPLSAELVPGISPAWYLIESYPNHERIAASHLIARRFGMFVPETEETIVRRGRKLDVTRLMFTGYLFVFVWDIDRHAHRIQSCPGVSRIVLTSDGEKTWPAVIKDQTIDQIRAVENTLRPLPQLMVDGMVSGKKKKPRWRKKNKDPSELQAERDCEIVACRPWSAFQDSLIALDTNGRNHALLNALGLSSTTSIV